MRYALISDIHSNLEALESVLAGLSKERIDKFLCIGDVVGYAANPAECIEIVRTLRCEASISGNHEWGVLGLLDAEYFSEDAKAAVVWTKGVLSKADLDYLNSFKLTYESRDFVLVHGSLDEPQEFRYIYDSSQAHPTLESMTRPLCFVGHTHAAGILYFAGGRIMYEGSGAVSIDHDRKYIINVGSVGQPRDGDPRASYALYDTDDKKVEIKRVAYDMESAKDKILKAGLPKRLALRLCEGR